MRLLSGGQGGDAVRNQEKKKVEQDRGGRFLVVVVGSFFLFLNEKVFFSRISYFKFLSLSLSLSLSKKKEKEGWSKFPSSFFVVVVAS